MAIQGKRSSVNPWVVLLALVPGLFMSLLDTTIVNIAVPSILDGLRASLDQILWVLNAYTLVYAVLLITGGRLGDIFGPRNLYVCGLTIFTAASAACGFAHDPTQLIVARALQGVGGAMLAPQSLPVVTTLFPPARRGGAFAVTGALAGLAVVIGPTLGGLLVTDWGWRWIFFVNVPVGVAAIALALLVVPDLRPGRRHRLDLAGVLLASVGLLAVVFGLVEGERYSWGTVTGFVTIPEIIGAGVLMLAAFLANQYLRQTAEPLLPFAIFKDRNYSLMTLLAAAMGFAMLGLFFPLTIYFQSVLGLSAVEAGLTIAPMPVVMAMMGGLSGNLADRFGGKYVLIPGLLLFAAGMAYIDWNAQAGSGRWSFLPGLVVAGVGLGFTWAPMFSIAMRNLKPELAGAASGVTNTMMELGSVIASAAVGALLQNRLGTALQHRAVAYSVELPPQFRGSFVGGFTKAARTGLQVGRGQSGTSLELPPGVPPGLVHLLQQVAHDVFTHAFVDAMRPTLVLPIVIVLVASMSCLAIRNRGLSTTRQPETTSGVETSPAV